MTTPLPSREESWALLCQYTEKEGLRKHALAVESAMRFYARKLGEDEALWSATGLLHDFDYERWPDEQNHPYRGVEILREKGYPEEMLTAILGHAPYTGVARESLLAKALFACDELAGFVVAVALIKPSKKVADVEVAGIKKRLKEKAFARGVNRDDVAQGTAELGLPFEEHAANVLAALQQDAELLGL